MKVFRVFELEEAREYSLSGDIAIHLHHIVFPNSPKCFKNDVRVGLPIAHVMCQDIPTLLSLSRRLGINKIKVEGQGTPNQHVDFCGKPLRELMKEAGEDIERHRREM